MKHASPLAFAALFAATSALADLAVTATTYGSEGTDEIYDSQNGAIIRATVDGNPQYVYVDWEQDNTKARIYLTGSGGEWTGTLPPAHAGTFNATTYAEDADGKKSDPYVTASSDIITNWTPTAQSLSNQRYPNIFSWTKQNSGKLTISAANVDDDWYGAAIERLSSYPQMVRLRGTMNNNTPAPSVGTSGGFIRTRVQIVDGVGSLWFKAKKANRRSNQGGTLVVEQITYTLKNNRPVYTYKTLATVTVPHATGVNEWHQYHLLLQDVPDPTKEGGYYRIRNTTLASTDAERSSSAAIDIQDVVFTPLIPDVVVYKDEADYAPGYPSLQDPVEFHIAVSNRWAGAPAANFTPVLVWRQEDEVWHETIMTNRAGRTDTGDGVYACVLDPKAADPNQRIGAGGFEYFYSVGFTGHTPRFKARKNTGSLYGNVVNHRFRWNEYRHLIHTNDWALLTDAEGYVNESRSPAYKPDFPDVAPALQYASSPDVATDSEAAASPWDFTSRFDVKHLEGEDKIATAPCYYSDFASGGVLDGEVRFAWPYSYLRFMADDGVRRFRSMYTHMAVVPRVYDEAAKGFRIDSDPVPGLNDAYAMELVGDYTWQAIIRQEDAIDGMFAVTGALHSAPGSTVFENGATNDLPDSPFFWLEVRQKEDEINPPSAGYVSNFLSSAEAHEREVTYYVDVPVTNRTDQTVDRLAVARPTGLGAVVDLPFAYQDGSSTNWTRLEAAWVHGTATTRRNVLAEGVSRDGGMTVEFYTQVATETVEYDDDDNEIVTTTWPAAWAPVVFETTEEGAPVVVTNWWPAEIPEGWLKWNWDGFTGLESAFPAYQLTGLSTNEWDLRELVWTTSRIDLVEVTLANSNNDGAPWLGVVLTDSALEVSPVATNAPGTYVESVTLGSTRVQETKTETYYTYEPVPTPYETSELGTRVQIDYDGFLMYRFCTTNGVYQIRRAAWQDFDSWQAVEDAYTRSFGIYDMQTFESDLTGRDLTTFEDTIKSGSLDYGLVSATEGWSSADTNLYWNGFAGTGLRLVRERMPTKAGGTTRNMSIWLNTHPTRQGPGHVETTQGNERTDRGTMTMRVRSASDDDRNITWRAADQMTNYKVFAKLQPGGTVSDAEHSISLIGYYTDPFNYWEARIVQKTYLTGQASRPERTWFEVHIYKWTEGVREEVFGKIKQQNMAYCDQNYTVSATSSARASFPGWKGNASGPRQSYYWDNPARDGTFQRTNNGGWTFVFELKTEDGKTKPSLYAYYSNDLATGKKDRYYKYDATEASNLAGGTVRGRPGFNMRDCGVKIAPYALTVTEWNNVASGNSCFKISTAQQLENICVKHQNEFWDFSETAAYDRDQKFNVWSIEKDASVTASSPIRLTRNPPTVYYRVKVYRSKEETPKDFMCPIGWSDEDGGYVQWDDRWDSYHANAGKPRNDNVKSVQSYGWTTVTLPMSFWDGTYLAVEALPDDGNGHPSQGVLAVDDIACDTWRGTTIYDEDFTGTSSSGRNLTDSFIATYSAIVPEKNNAKGRRYELNRSRANPNQTQGLSTPRLVRGVGDILFTYEVADYPVEVGVQLVNATGTGFSEIATERLEADTSGTLYVPCLSNQTGRLRVEVRTPEDAEEWELGTLYVDDVRATDYPATGETSWEVYNALVSSFQNDPSLKFDGASRASASRRSAVLNDGTRHDTLKDNLFAEHVPFVQTPTIETGVGEVSFWYRASPDNDGRPAQISLMVADTIRRPDGDWRPLTVDDLYWDNQTYSNSVDDAEYMRQCEALNALTNIVTEEWTYFSVEFYQKDFRVLRILTGDTNTTVQSIAQPIYSRVMLDNVLITEPVRASIDVGSIEFVPGIPLCSGPTDAKITLVNPRMNPDVKNVYLDWYVDTSEVVDLVSTNVEVTVIEHESDPIEVEVLGPDGQIHTASYTTNWTETLTKVLLDRTRVPRNMTWGYETWSNRWGKGTVAGGSIPCTNAVGDSRLWLTSEPIPTDRFPADSIFQYCVRVDYLGAFNLPVFSETQGKVRNGFWFENPSWYDPIDLNVTFGTQERPVAHFWNFSCSTNVVFFNEFQPVYGSLNDLKTQFIELMGPEGASIANWRVEHFGRNENGTPDPDYIVFTNILTRDARFLPANNATTNKGWGFWVLGCHGVAAYTNQELFPPAWVDVTSIKDTPWYMGQYGALRLRRSMGAYVDAVAWGTQSRVTDFMNLGFKYLRQFNTNDRALAWQGSGEDELQWAITRNRTIGGYNYEEEDSLPFLTANAAPEEEVPGIEQPEIRSFEFQEENKLLIRVAVRLDAESAGKGLVLKPGHYNWSVQYASDFRLLDNAATRFESDFALPVEVRAEDGWVEFDIEGVDILPNSDAAFYRVSATPAK